MYDRSKTIGASDAVHIQAGKWAELYDRKTSSDAPDYGLPAELGHRLEAFNLELFERDTGREIHVDDNWGSDPLRLADEYWCTYLPDGLLNPLPDECLTITDDEYFIPFEAKAVNMMWRPENLLKKYMPQLQHAMRVMKAPHAIFSVIYLNTRYEWIKVDYDPPYDDALFEKEKLFQWFLETGKRPPEKKGRKWV